MGRFLSKSSLKLNAKKSRFDRPITACDRLRLSEYINHGDCAFCEHCPIFVMLNLVQHPFLPTNGFPKAIISIANTRPSSCQRKLASPGLGASRPETPAFAGVTIKTINPQRVCNRYNPLPLRERIPTRLRAS